MVTKPIPMQVSDLDAVGEVLQKETGHCEICGAPLPLWPPDGITEHAYTEHNSVMWPAHREQMARFLAEPDSVEKQVLVRQQRAEYLVKILATRHDLYAKLVDAGAITTPRKG